MISRNNPIIPKIKEKCNRTKIIRLSKQLERRTISDVFFSKLSSISDKFLGYRLDFD